MKKWMQKKEKRFFALLLVIVFGLSSVCGFSGASYVKAEVSENGLNLPATVTATKLNVRKKPSIEAAQLKYKKAPIYLTQGKPVTILSEAVMNGTKWYQVTFSYNGKNKTGFAMAQYIKLTMNSTNISGTISNSAGEKTTTLYKKANVSGGAVLTGNNGLKDGQKVTILKEKTVGNTKWFKLSVKVGDTRYRGFAIADHVALKRSSGVRLGVVNDEPLNVRVGAGTENAVLQYGGGPIRLSKGTEVKILGQKKKNGVKWYQVSFKHNNVTLSGFVMGEYIDLKGTEDDENTKPEPTISPQPSQTASPGAVTVSEGAVSTTVPTTLSDADFAKSLAAFPADYQVLLMALHEKYPSWQFTAYNTGLDWEKAVSNENVVGLNLISNAKGVEWKSILEGAYDWTTDTFVPFDGTNWVTCSQSCLEYYMDPRNFLTADGIFQFENLSYNSENQDLSGINKILAGTALAGASYTYVDSSGSSVTKTYAETFLEAAKASGVSPYYLASRAKQEVLSGTTLSNSVTGKVSGYEGYYNFYNIGANNSTVSGQNVINGLIFAKTGNNMSSADMEKYMIPWNNPYNAIVGGAKYIGNNYINRGQNTIYLQKFNVTAYSRYSHQYMANVEAAKAEAQKIYSAYMDLGNISAIFSIPVYNNMPASPAPIPSGGKNPNNWLKSLSVQDSSTKKELALSPAFRVTSEENASYSITVGADVTKVNIKANAVSSLSTVSGTGAVTLKKGTNTIVVKVTSEAGTVREYTLTINKTA